jgi:hypothetical protein
MREDDVMRTIEVSRTAPVGYTSKLVDIGNVRITDRMRWHMKHQPYLVKKKVNKNDTDTK